MDGQLKAVLIGKTTVKRGGAVLALPLLLVLALQGWIVSPAFSKPGEDVEAEPPHVDATAMGLMAKSETLDDVTKALGFPSTGAQFALYGGGATLGKGAFRLGLQAMVGGLSARQGGINTEWRLRLGNLLMEQRYPFGQFLVTGGTILTGGEMQGTLENNSTITRYDGAVLGGGVVVGGRWPRLTRMGFVARTGYEWLLVNGLWKGALAAVGPRASFDLGGPFAQVQVEISF